MFNIFIKEALALVYWLCLYNFIMLLDNAVFSIMTTMFSPLIIISFARVVAWIHFAFTALLATRLFLFEYMYKSTPYLSERDVKEKHTV